ncbi:MAG: hypothetical protein AAFN50_03085 [Pseudomonadota bacterium]
MRPLAAVTLIILGSCLAITVSLGAVIIIVLVLGDEYPRLQNEFSALLSSVAIFFTMTVISALSFYTSLKTHKARFWLQALMWAALLATGWYYWP